MALTEAEKSLEELAGMRKEYKWAYDKACSLHKDGYETIEDLPPFMVNERPFLYKRMTIETFCKEEAYFGIHFGEYHDGKYTPIWKQCGEEHMKYDGMK